MNAKLCKRLRREAREASVGKPQRHLLYFSRRSTARNAANTTRDIYRLLKARAAANVTFENIAAGLRHSEALVALRARRQRRRLASMRRAA